MTTLADRINALKFKYLLQSGEDAECLYVPRARLRDFCAAVADEWKDEGMPPAHHVYHFLAGPPEERREFALCGLDVRVLTDGDDIGVGRPMNS